MTEIIPNKNAIIANVGREEEELNSERNNFHGFEGYLKTLVRKEKKNT